MIKKISVFILLFLVGFLFVGNQVYGATEDTVIIEETDAFYHWNLVSNNGVYMLVSDRILNEATYLEMNIYTLKDLAYQINDPDVEEVFVNQINLETSRITTYQDNTSVSAINNYPIDYIDVFTPGIMILNDELYTNYGINIGQYYYSITLVFSETLTSYERDYILAVANNDNATLLSIIDDNHLELTLTDLDFQFLDVWFTNTPIIVDPNNLSVLPETNGSIFDDINQMADVTMTSITDYQVNFRITYNQQAYDMSYTFTANTDMTIFNNENEMFYYTYENQHFIVINESNTSMFYQTGLSNSDTFIAYTTWNLDTNELSKIDRFNVYMYMKIGSGNHLLGYFYVDQFVIDNLISVNASFDYRFEPWIGNPGAWQDYQSILEDGAYTESNLSWQVKALDYSTAATFVAAMIPGIGLPLAIVGTAISAYIAYDMVQELIDGNNLWISDTEEIQNYIPSTLMETEINQAYENAYSEFSGLDLSTYNLWQLDFGTFEKPFNDLAINEESVNVISFTYMTNGQVYTIDQQNIHTQVTIDDELVPGDQTIDPWQQVIDYLKALYHANQEKFILVAAIVIAIAVGIVLTMLKKLKKPIKAVLTIPGLIITTLIILTLIYFLGT